MLQDFALLRPNFIKISRMVRFQGLFVINTTFYKPFKQSFLLVFVIDIRRLEKSTYFVIHLLIKTITHEIFINPFYGHGFINYR